MCELFGVCSQEPYYVNDYLKEFYSHSSKHPHGWGLACMGRKDALVEKETVQATKSNYLKERLSLPIQEKTVFAHIRYATIGNVEYKNCHPYTRKDHNKRCWTMIHNGTIFDFPPLHRYVKLQTGDTDSERILMYLVDRIDQEEARVGRQLNSKERFWLLDSIIVEMSKGNKLNLLLYDGEIMYVHTNYADSLHFLRKEGSVIFSTTPLSDEDWKPVPFMRLLAYQEGHLVLEGTKHQNEYIESEENLKFLYQIFADL